MRPEYIKGNARAAELESLRDERNRWVDKKRDYESEFAALRSQVEELGRDRKEARDAFERMVSERERLSAQVEELTRELDDIKSQEHYCPDCKMLCQYCSCWSETNARLEEQVEELTRERDEAVSAHHKLQSRIDSVFDRVDELATDGERDGELLSLFYFEFRPQEDNDA